MARIVLGAVFYSFMAICLHAQSPNQWIDFSQNYYKIPVAKDGIYKVTYLQLQQIGFPVQSIDPRNLQLFHRGKEQAITVDGESDSQFNPSDFIEFFGKKNDGTRDTKLYEAPSMQPHSYYNIFSDTTAYFLTVGNTLGKRMSYFFESNSLNLPSEPYYIEENLTVVSEDYSPGPILEYMMSSTFDNGEGWTSSYKREGQFRDFVISNVTRTVSSGPAPVLEMIFVGRNELTHNVQVYAGSSMRLISTFSFSGFDPYKLTENLAWSDITPDGKLNVRFQIVNNGNNDFVSVSTLKLTYAREPNADGSELVVKTVPDNSGKVFLSIQGVPSGANIFDISDSDNVKLIGHDAATTFDAIVPDAETARTLYITPNTLTPVKISSVRFKDLVPGQSNYIIITHPKFRKPGLDYTDPVKAYAEYRASVEGGGYDTLIVHSQQLFDQFNYGESSPLAIYEFLKYISQPKLPAYLFIIGKGLELTYKYYRSASSPNDEFLDYVPAAGYPAADMVFSLGLGGASYSGGIPTGRLPATQPKDVAAYLNKVKEMEALPFDNLWRKRILHLSGGIETYEPALFQSYLKDFQTVAEGEYVGPQVDAIAKQSRDVQIINISEQVNSGLELVTFLGHSSTSTLDFDIGYVTNPVLGYNNKGKYPMLLMNGCEVGSFFYKFRMFGEDWVVADKLGATAFIAHNAYGLVNMLFHYSRKIYEVAYKDSTYTTKGIGDIKLKAGKLFIEKFGENEIVYRSQVQQMILLGDPSVKLFGAEKPDLEIKPNNISVLSLNQEKVTAASDSFAIKMIVRNYGSVRSKLYKVEVERTLPDNTLITYDSLFNIPYNADTLLFIVRRTNEIPFGNNRFKIRLDSDNIISELNEQNNEATMDFIFQLNGTKNLFPSDFHIVNNTDLTLTFQSTDLFSQERDFMIELDTTNTFNSPFYQSFKVSGKVLGVQSVQLLSLDTTAYFWRTKLAEPLQNESSEWVGSSFTYINNGNEGWAQVHFSQFINDASVGLVKDQGIRRFTFEKSVLPVDVQTFGAAAGKPADSTSVKIDNTEYNMTTQGWSCRGNTINLIAFDRKSTYPYVGVDMKWYEVLYTYGRRMICGRQPFVINSFAADEVSATGRPDLIDYVGNIAEGDSVLLFTIGNAGIPTWPEDAKLKLAEFGISLAQLNALADMEAVIIFGKKGASPGSAKVFKTSDPSVSAGKVSAHQTITGGYSAGTISSFIGPAYAWQQIEWKVSEKESQDSVSFNLFGVKSNRQEVLLLQNVTAGQDISFIDAQEYPDLRIEFYNEDNTLLTPSQIKNWIVYFTPVPEGVLLPMRSTEPTVANEGQPAENDYGFLNVSDKSFKEDLQVRYTLFNNERSEGNTQIKTLTAPAPGDTTQFSVSYATENMSGWNDVEVFVNPRLVPERHFDNNLIQLRDNVFVSVDKNSPVTDVTFDGRHIVNGDYVSPKPLINITLWDENRYLLKKDTVGITVFLTGPCDPVCDPRYIPFSGSEIKWHAATADQDFSIDFTPELVTGDYILTIETSDASGNKSEKPYEIAFRVEEQTNFTFVEPYPNPCIYDLEYGFIFSGKDNVQKTVFEVRDVTGRKIYSLENNQELAVGQHLFYWPGVDNNWNYLKTGFYFVTFTVSVGGRDYVSQSKVVLAR
jgi:hypothetical protein